MDFFNNLILTVLTEKKKIELSKMKKKNIPFFIFNPLYSDKFVVKKKRYISDIITKIFWGGVPTTPKSIRFPPYSSVLGPVDLKYNRLGILCCGGLNNTDPIFSCIYAQNPKKKKNFYNKTAPLRYAEISHF